MPPPAAQAPTTVQGYEVIVTYTVPWEWYALLVAWFALLVLVGSVFIWEWISRRDLRSS